MKDFVGTSVGVCSHTSKEINDEQSPQASKFTIRVPNFTESLMENTVQVEVVKSSSLRVGSHVDGSPSASVGMGARPDESVGEFSMGDWYDGLFDESEDDGSYIPSSEDEETDDEMEVEELVSEDEEYTQRRKKAKEKKGQLFAITDDMLLGIVNGGQKSDYVSEYENSEEDNIYSDSTDSTDHKNLKLCIGMRFINMFQARDAFTDNAVENGWEIHFKRANWKQFEAGCKTPCTWKCSGSFMKNTCAVVIKNLEGENTCPRDMRNKIVTSNWIVKLRPELGCKDIGKDLMQRYAFDATKWRLYYSKRKAIDMLRGTVEAHYLSLRRYTRKADLNCMWT